MSIRTLILADPAGAAKEIAEGLSGLPLVWIPMLTSSDLESLVEMPQVTVDRKQGMDRISSKLPFLQEQFSELDDLAENTQALLEHFKKSRSKTLAIDMTDPVCMDAKHFIGALKTAVSAIESSDAGASFKVGRYKYKTTREVLCYLSTLDPDNGMTEREQMIGDLW
ncbi:MAG: hypothetical protein AAGI63_17920 [Planctomycetota bacterium]